ncbi:hypothetical protein BOX37_20385 [Nocardia mangyaensis]|uniref:Uncharacterized protein n=1 Tax=Nocardia mangyaensis TaxID=2213200 RepID=A0A1J0VV61_9NOCA|nr:hypothetical protein [Nocardia mangyaensis]APE35909.1 hypothetical protein BOX37_20385 [Nocardia mangyaensis]
MSFNPGNVTPEQQYPHTGFNPGNITSEPLAVDRPQRAAETRQQVSAQYSTAPAVPTGSTTARAQATIEAVAGQFQKYLDSIHAPDYTGPGLRNRIAAFGDTPAAQAIETAVETARDRAASALTAVETARRELSPQGDTATELRNTRYWDRARRIFDSVQDGKLVSVAEKTLNQARPEELGVLIEELGPYLDSRGAGTAWIAPVLSKVAPTYATARQRLTDAEKALTITEHNATQLRRQMGTTHAPAGYRKPTFVDARAYDPDR